MQLNYDCNNPYHQLISPVDFATLFEKPPQRSLDEGFNLILGPCAIESEVQIHDIATQLGLRGIRYMRGGAFKPRTRIHDFQGHGLLGLKWMRSAADAHRLKIVTEVVSEADVEAVAHYADILQIGTRNMFNYALLKRAGETGKTVLLKRGFSATVKELLHAAEYIMASGSRRVILCERGMRSHDPMLRNMLDLSSAIVIKKATGLEVIIDPSHATGFSPLVLPLSLSAQAAGLDGAMIEISLSPDDAVCDGHQAMTLEAMDQLIHEVNNRTNRGLRVVNSQSLHSEFG
jgi:3-deoxy-7-phosphoheptulonate synthase/chorismate mutase